MYSVIFKNNSGNYSVIIDAENEMEAIAIALKDIVQGRAYYAVEAVLIINYQDFKTK